uniref:Uncharacterized protein n=1 Tax=Oryza glumipatula TaxID=40148 RepID=A0A0E0BDT9_9ORYZ
MAAASSLSPSRSRSAPARRSSPPPAGRSPRSLRRQRFPRMDTGCCSVVATIARHSVRCCTVTNAFSCFSATAELQRQE